MTRSIRRKDPIGIGISHPFSFTSEGSVSKTTSSAVSIPSSSGIGPGSGTIQILLPNDADKRTVVNNSITRIISTPQFSRWFEGRYGSLVDTLLFNPNSELTRNAVEAFATTAVALNESRVTLLTSGNSSSEDGNAMNISMAYKVKGDSVVGQSVISIESEL